LSVTSPVILEVVTCAKAETLSKVKKKANDIFCATVAQKERVDLYFIQILESGNSEWKLYPGAKIEAQC
jgi:hypothetical protein